MKYLFETFDYTFFPSSSDMLITLESENVERIQVFGSPSELHDQPYGEEETTKGNTFTVARSQSCFPSEIEIDKN